jgi:plastocyanin
VNAPNAPGDVVLFHEMTHAQHNAHGTRDMTPRADNFDNNEEFNTIGPENEYRDERGVPRRADHHTL